MLNTVRYVKESPRWPSNHSRPRRRALTRQHLLEAAAVTFARRGFHSASLDEVAAAAGFSKGAVYSNFKNKEDLFLTLLDERLQREFATAKDALSHDPAVSELSELVSRLMWDDDWTALQLEFSLYAVRNPHARAKLAALRRQAIDETERMIRADYERRGVAPQIAPRVVATLVLAIFRGLGLEHLVDSDLVDPPTVEAILALLTGIEAQPPALPG